jgi:hypothetical protein
LSRTIPISAKDSDLMHAFDQSLETIESKSPTLPMRFSPVLNLSTGASHGLVCEARSTFEDRVSFGPVAATSLNANPAKWLGSQIEQMAVQLANQCEFDRPVIMPAPLTALAHSNTALACDAATRRTEVCHQEICLEFVDSAFAGDPTDITHRVGTLKRRGFRVGIDLRKSWLSPLNSSLCLLLDTMRVDAKDLLTNGQLLDTVFAASETGIMVIAENTKWRDGQALAALGIHVAVQPAADA